jgi:[acyl-carrier-protein] S-malonyltransferase
MSKIAFIFPGQGAQKAGMGKDFYENSKTAAEVIDRASELLGLDMKALCFEENDLLDQTEYTQAALVTVCMAMEKVLRERGLAPDVTAGLSLGEYCAIASAGGMSTENAITTVRKRGILMQNAVPGGQGAMAAVLGLDVGRSKWCNDRQLQLSGTDCDYRMEGRCGTGSRCTEGSRSKESPSA